MTNLQIVKNLLIELKTKEHINIDDKIIDSLDEDIENEKLLDILKQHIIDSCVTFGSDYDSHNSISFKVEVIQPKNFINEISGEEMITCCNNADFEKVLKWLKENKI